MARGSFAGTTTLLLLLCLPASGLLVVAPWLPAGHFFSAGEQAGRATSSREASGSSNSSSARIRSAPRPARLLSSSTITTTIALHASSSASSAPPLLEEEQEEAQIQQDTASHVNSDNNVSTNKYSRGGGGALSRTVSELAEILGGWGRARLAWDCYRIGVDPAVLFGENSENGEEKNNSDGEKNQRPAGDSNKQITRHLPGSRRTQRLGAPALRRLAALHQANCPGGGADRVDGGVARLSYRSSASDGTTKLLLRLHDDTEVETVIIPWHDAGRRSTLCISSQVGCRQGCTFCATGRMGKVRSLSTDEILAQMFFARQLCRQMDDVLPPVTNVVFMGMGEPSDNADAVVASIHQLTARDLFGLAATKVTVSTVAPTPDAFRKFADAPCVLAWSVHAARDELRRRLVPTARHSVAELRQSLVETLCGRPANLRTTMLEVALMDGVNDSMEDADALAKLARSIVEAVPECKLMVNLIPYNEISAGSILSYRKPSAESLLRFQRRLWSAGVYAHVRTTRGDDAQAACGQLVTTKRQKQTKAQTT